MKPSLFNKICAHPVLVSCITGACTLDIIVLPKLSSIASDFTGWIFLILGAIGATGIGSYMGVFTCLPWLARACRRFNGAPFEPGDKVVILAGPLTNTVAKVEDITKGQGGWDVVLLALTPEHRKRFSNIFEQYSLMKIKGVEKGMTDKPLNK